MRDEQKTGDPRPAIVFITSISAAVSSLFRAEYCISKAALSMTATLFADRLGEVGGNGYEIRGGIIGADMTAPGREQYEKLISEGVVALAKGHFPFSTGLVLEVSGGVNTRRL